MSTRTMIQRMIGSTLLICGVMVLLLGFVAQRFEMQSAPN